MERNLQNRLRAVLIGPDAEFRREFREALAPFSAVELLAERSEYPDQIQLGRLLRVHGPQVLFVEFHRTEEVEMLMSRLHREARELPVVGLGGTRGQMDLELLRQMVQLGLHDVLIRPFQREAVEACLASVRRKLEEAPSALQFTDHLCSFLPARPGVGATTLAISTAAAFRRLDMAVLLVDLDLASGLVRFLLRLGRQHSLSDAVVYANDLDPEIWRRLVNRTLPIDVLHSGRLNPQAQIHAGQLEALIDYARRHYGAMCFDLSGNVEAYSVQVLEDSKHICLVTTPEPSALQLGREKLAYLESMGLRSRVRLLVNRADQSLGVDPARIPEVMRMPVFQAFHNDYEAVSRAVQRGELVAENERLGEDCDQFVTKLLNSPTVGWSSECVPAPLVPSLEDAAETKVPA